MTSDNQTSTEQVTTNQTPSATTSSFSTTTIIKSTATTHITSVTVATSTTKTGLNDGEIAGVAVGVIFFILIIVAIILFIVIRRRKHNGESIIDKESNDLEINKSVEQSKKRRGNKYVKKSPTKSESQVYENPGEYYENVANTDDSQRKKNTKPAVKKQDSIPMAPAPPPPIDRTSMTVNKDSTCPAIEDDEYIVPEHPSKLSVKPPLDNKRKPQNKGSELYLPMDSSQRDEMYISPDSPHSQESYMNIDVQDKPFEDEERKEGLKDYVNLSKQEKGVAFGVRPKEIYETPKQETTIPITKSDEGSYQNVLYENASKQKKKPRRKK